jgi:hypothetical protein
MDNQRIQEFTETGTPVTEWGKKGIGNEIFLLVTSLKGNSSSS